MSNPAKDKGTRAETAVVRCLLAHGIPAERRALKGAADEGDVWACGGRVVIEVKSRKVRPSDEAIAQMWHEANREALRVAHCEAAVLVINRPGKADPALWWAALNPPDYLWLLGVEDDPGLLLHDDDDLVLVQFGGLVRRIASHPALMTTWTRHPGIEAGPSLAALREFLAGGDPA